MAIDFAVQNTRTLYKDRTSIMKTKIKFSSYIRKFRWERGCKVICEEGLTNIWGNEQIFSHLWLCNRSLLDFLIYEENFVFFFISAWAGSAMQVLFFYFWNQFFLRFPLNGCGHNEILLVCDTGLCKGLHNYFLEGKSKKNILTFYKYGIIHNKKRRHAVLLLFKLQ